MLIAIDYDGAFAKDKIFWGKFVQSIKLAQHHVVCVTSRFPEQHIIDFPGEVIYTSGNSKQKLLKEKGVWVDVWIESTPLNIL